MKWTPERLELFIKMYRDTYRPHRLFKTVDGKIWETISYPWIDVEAGEVRVKIRVPGDPTTIREVEAINLDPEDRDCYCAQAGEFYFFDERNSTLPNRLNDPFLSPN